MEKQAKPINKILKLLPKAASSVSVSFQNRPFSPGKHKTFAGKGFSGPMIPAEARRKSKAETLETQEPTSPKISCMGQIKHKESVKRVSPPKTKATNPISESSSSGEVKKHASKFRRIFSMGKPAKKPEHAPKVPDRAPCLGQMKRFASGRDAFASFDWTTSQIAHMEADHRRDYYSDEEEEERRDSNFEEEDVISPFSAPITVGGGRGGGVPLQQTRKEINIWKRRTMNPPRPLHLNTTVTAN